VLFVASSLVASGCSDSSAATPKSVRTVCAKVSVAANSTAATMSPQDVYNIVRTCQEEIKACGAGCPTYGEMFELGESALRAIEQKYPDEVQPW
jgi:cytochrome c5